MPLICSCDSVANTFIYLSRRCQIAVTTTTQMEKQKDPRAFSHLSSLFCRAIARQPNEFLRPLCDPVTRARMHATPHSPPSHRRAHTRTVSERVAAAPVCGARFPGRSLEHGVQRLARKCSQQLLPKLVSQSRLRRLLSPAKVTRVFFFFFSLAFFTQLGASPPSSHRVA